MKTKILLIGLIIFLVNVISVNAKETIKVCSPNDIWRGVNYFVFPEDGGKPYGSHVGTLLSLTNSLNLEIEFVQVKGGKEEGFLKNCFDKMRSGEIDLMTYIFDNHTPLYKGKKSDYMILIPYLECPESWKCKGNNHFNFGISKKSKFASRVDEFKSALLSDDDYRVIEKTKFTSADQHDWVDSDNHLVDRNELINHTDQYISQLLTATFDEYVKRNQEKNKIREIVREFDSVESDWGMV